MWVPSLLARLLPLRIRIRLVREAKTSRLILDDTAFPECHSKVVETWSWVRFKNEKTVVHFYGGKFIRKKIG